MKHRSWESPKWRPAILIAATAAGLSTAACGRPAPHDLSAQGGLWAVDVAGLKIGQTCQSAHARFRPGGWTYSSSGWTSPPAHRELMGAEYNRPGEIVDFGCVTTADGPRVSSVRYTPQPGLMDRQQLMAAAVRKFGPPSLQFSMVPQWTMYRWGDVGPSGPDNSTRGKAKPHADLSLKEFGSQRDTFLEVDTGSDWVREQGNAIAAAKNAELRRSEKPSLQ